MSNFFNLLLNEQIKIFIRKSTWVMYIAIVCLILFTAAMEKVFGDHPTEISEDWRVQLEEENERINKEIKDFDEDGGDLFSLPPNPDRIEINNFYLEKDIKPQKYGAWNFIFDNAGLLSLISLFTIIIAANIIASEHHLGTIKLLLIRPISRTKILLSKFTSILIFTIITSGFLFISSYIIGAIFFGIESGINPHSIVLDFNNSVKGDIISANADYYKYTSLPQAVFSQYGYQMVIFVMMATLALMISTIFKNNALAIGVAIFLMFAGNTIVFFLEKYSWAKFILFANLDLSQYVNDAPMFEGMTLQFSIINLLVHFVFFLGVAWFVFVKRDVTE